VNKKLALQIIRIADWAPRDQVAWHEACRSGGWLDDSGPLARFAPTRLRVLEAAYGRWLGFLAERHTEIIWEDACDCLDTENIAAFVKRMSESLSPRSIATYLEDLRIVVRALAPTKSFPVLDRITDHFRSTARPTKNKRNLVVPTRDLVGLGFALMDGSSQAATSLHQAQQYRDGLMIVLLASLPIRIGNLLSLEIDRHLISTTEGFRLVFPGAEVKNHRPLDYPIWEGLTEPMATYLSTHRPRLLQCRGRHRRDDPGQALWISGDGTALKRVAIWTLITRRTKKRFGVSVNPHLFRDCAATSTAIELPDQVGIIQAVLGHTNTVTGQKYYNQARGIEAARRFQKAIESLMDREPS